MAARDLFWVDGAGDWSDAATHWAAASGGAPAAGNLPTAQDTVHFDVESGAEQFEVTLDVVARCASLVVEAGLVTFISGGVSMALASVSSAPDDGSVSVTPEATPMQVWVVGDQVPLVATFLDGAGAPGDPDAVTAAVLLPDGTEENLSADVVRTDVGVYQVLYAPTVNGLHAYRFAGTGDLQAAAEAAFMAQTEFPEEPA